MADDPVRTSKFLSRVLRHEPQSIGITLDVSGWVPIDDLLRQAAAHGKPITRSLLESVVATSDKQRFAISDDGTRIRANQGHSVEVDLALAPVEPPAVLFHGTAMNSLASIRAGGLIRGRRQHVHLSPDAETATKVGRRHGVPVVLSVAAGDMHAAGLVFYRSDNGVWLTDNVPVRFIEFPAA